MGRKPLPDDDRRDMKFQIRLSESEYQVIHDAAVTAYKGRPMSSRGIIGTWSRDTLLKAAQRQRQPSKA